MVTFGRVGKKLMVGQRGQVRRHLPDLPNLKCGKQQGEVRFKRTHCFNHTGRVVPLFLGPAQAGSRAPRWLPLPWPFRYARHFHGSKLKDW